MTKISNYVRPGSMGIVSPSTPGSTSVIQSSVLTTEGDLLYEHSGAPTRLPIGSNTYVLTSDGTDPSWQPGGGGSTPLTTKGDLFTYTTVNARLPVGSDTYILAADSTQATGLKWEPAPSGTSPLTTKGDLWGFSTVDARIPVGSNTYVLTADSTQALGVKWAAAGGGGGAGSYAHFTETASASSTTGTWVVTAFAVGIYSYLWYNSSNAQNDQLTWTRWLDPGTYTLVWYGAKNVDRAIMTVKFDGTTVGSIDCYNGSLIGTSGVLTGLTMGGSSGAHTIQIIGATRNASASGWYVNFNEIQLFRTA